MRLPNQPIRVYPGHGLDKFSPCFGFCLIFDLISSLIMPWENCQWSNLTACEPQFRLTYRGGDSHCLKRGSKCASYFTYIHLCRQLIAQSPLSTSPSVLRLVASSMLPAHFLHARWLSRPAPSDKGAVPVRFMTVSIPANHDRSRCDSCYQDPPSKCLHIRMESWLPIYHPLLLPISFQPVENSRLKSIALISAGSDDR